MFRSSSLAAWRGARGLLFQHSERIGANHLESLTGMGLVGQQPHVFQGRHSFWHRAYLEAGAGGSHSSASALAKKLAKDDENARRFFIAATGTTTAFIAYVRLKGNPSPKPGFEGTAHEDESMEHEQPDVEEVPPPLSTPVVARSDEEEQTSESNGAEGESDSAGAESDSAEAAVASGEEGAVDGAEVVEVEAPQSTAAAEGASEPEIEGEVGGGSGANDAMAVTEEKEEDCGFCAFMKTGPCGEVFTGWEECVDKAEAEGKSIVDECVEATMKLRDCMGQNMEYYGAVLEAERQMGEIEKRDAEAREELSQKKKGDQEAEELLHSFEEALDVARGVLREDQKTAEETDKKGELDGRL